jgi:hypothetical protein
MYVAYIKKMLKIIKIIASMRVKMIVPFVISAFVPLAILLIFNDQFINGFQRLKHPITNISPPTA